MNRNEHMLQEVQLQCPYCEWSLAPVRLLTHLAYLHPVRYSLQWDYSKCPFCADDFGSRDLQNVFLPVKDISPLQLRDANMVIYRRLRQCNAYAAQMLAPGFDKLE